MQTDPQTFCCRIIRIIKTKIWRIRIWIFWRFRCEQVISQKWTGFNIKTTSFIFRPDFCVRILMLQRNILWYQKFSSCIFMCKTQVRIPSKVSVQHRRPIPSLKNTLIRCSEKKNTKRSSALLRRLVFFYSEQTLCTQELLKIFYSRLE